MKTLLNYLFFYSLLSNFLFASNNELLEIPFDTPKLYLLENNITLKYQAKAYRTKNKKKIKYHENIIYQSQTRKRTLFKVKHYNRVKFQEDKHPLLSLVKREERNRFINMLKYDGIEYPLKLRAVYGNPNELFFKLKFQYPYLIHLLNALSISSIGILLILIVFRKRVLHD